METVTLASNEADVRALEAIEAHHAELSAGLALRVDAMLRAAGTPDAGALRTARDALVAWCRRELEPHAGAEEETLYQAAREIPRLEALIKAMSKEHELLVALVARLERADDAVVLAATAGALHELFDAHAGNENELILPALATEPTTSLAELLDGMHEAIGSPSTGTVHADAHTCNCHDDQETDYPELDARSVPHAIRHATIFGALDAVAAGGGMILIAPHDPLPLLAQIEGRNPGMFEVEYLERGPEAWRLQFVRQTA